MKTGDLLLCSGNGMLSRRIARTQELFAKVQKRPELIDSRATEITHVAGIVMDNLVFESTTLNKWNGKRGVQINNFADWIRNYDGSVWIRESGRIESPERVNREAAQLTGTPYEHGIPGALELISCGVPGGVLAKRLVQTTNIHCSEGWAMALYNADIMYYCRFNKLPPMEWWDGYGIVRDFLPPAFYTTTTQIK